MSEHIVTIKIKSDYITKIINRLPDGGRSVISLFFVFSYGRQVDAGFQDWLKETAKKLGGEKGLSEDEIIIKTIPFADYMSFDLDQYVTEKALNGLYLMLAEEEKKIRQDPTARVMNLLKKVFGSQ